MWNQFIFNWIIKQSINVYIIKTKINWHKKHWIWMWSPSNLYTVPTSVSKNQTIISATISNHPAHLETNQIFFLNLTNILIENQALSTSLQKNFYSKFHSCISKLHRYKKENEIFFPHSKYTVKINKKIQIKN